MTANELRIGNWVLSLFEPNQKPRQIIDIDFISAFIYYYKPIPLTEEWLVKFGFQYRKDFNEFIYKDGYWSVYKYDDFFYFDMGNIEVPLNNVHELQNLYFALTGEELLWQEKK